MSRSRRLKKPVNPHRLKNIYRAQLQRARKFGQRLDYVVDDLEALWKEQPLCPYCGVLLILANISFDHKVAVSRGGIFTLTNLLACCGTCNRAKSILSYDQFSSLCKLLKEWQDYQSQNDVLTRLRLGAAMKHGWRPKRSRRRMA